MVDYCGLAVNINIIFRCSADRIGQNDMSYCRSNLNDVTRLRISMVSEVRIMLT